MKKNLVLIMAVLLSAACQKSEEQPVVLQDASINFSAYVGRGATKGVVTDVTVTNLDTFRVACYNTGTSTSYFATEQKATKNSDKYKTSTPYYWPKGNLDFFAYRGTVTGGVSNTSGTATIAYTVPAAANEDFVGASVKDQGKASSVGLAFDHLLTKVDSLVLAPITGGTGATGKYKYKFTAVTVTAPKNGGTYNFNSIAWESPLSGSEATYKFTTQSGDFLGSASKTLKDGTVNDQLIFLPQEVTFKVTYSVEYTADGSNWTEIMSSITKSAKITLDKGVAYGITLHLPIDSSAASEIVFTVTVNDWGKGSKDATLE